MHVEVIFRRRGSTERPEESDTMQAPTSEPTPWREFVAHSWAELNAYLHDEGMVPRYPSEGGHRRSSYVFRGMAQAAWGLKTSLERLGSPPAQVEGPMLRAFGKYASAGSLAQGSEWSRLAVAQHNGLATRVLDWTASPLIGAHFATAEREHAGQDGVVWCVDVTAVRNALLSETMYAQLHDAKAWMYNVPMLDHAFPTLRDFDATAQTHGDMLLFFEPPSIDARIHNQYGVLSAMNGPSTSHDAFLRARAATHPDLVRRVIIHRDAKAEIRDMLDQNNITERMLFPGLPGLCDWLCRYYGPG